MVDVVFVLLLFFMACAGQNVKEGFFQIGLPSAGASASDKPVTPIVIDVDPVGNVYVNGTAKSASPKDRELKQLQTDLEASMRTSPDDPVIIRPNPDARHERIIDVLNVCRLAKVAKLSFG